MKPFGLLAMMTVSMVWAQEQGGLKARELFYTPLPSPAAPAQKPVNPAKPTAGQTTPARTNTTGKAVSQAPASPANPAKPVQDAHLVQAAVPLGLRYAVLKRNDAGKFEETDADASFRAGDRIRLQVDANTAGYLYVVMQGSSGSWRLLFPATEVAGGSNHVQRGQSLQIPPGDRGQFVFDEQAGTEKLFLVLTRQPENDLDKLIYSMGGAQAPPNGDGRLLVAQAAVRDDLVNRLRGEVQSRDLVFEKVDTASAPAPAGGGAPRVENAAYVVSKSTAPDARLVVDVALRHR
jgi:hypothetical protein